MTLPSSGPISMSQVNVELERASNAAISLGETAVRGLFGVASGTINLSDGFGKTHEFHFNIGSVSDADLRTLALNAGWNGTTRVVATVASGTVVSGSGPTAAITISGSFPKGVILINNGTIAGRAGNGGQGGSGYYPGSAGYGGGSGHTALAVSVPVTIYNNGTIAGGGGGGGGGGGAIARKYTFVQQDKQAGYLRLDWEAAGGGGGGGAGRGNNHGNPGGAGGGAGGIQGGVAGGNGGNGWATGEGAGGAGGNHTHSGQVHAIGGNGGNGGFWGAQGAWGGGTQYLVPNDANGAAHGGGGPGNGGLAVSGNGNITWGATGTRYGGIQ